MLLRSRSQHCRSSSRMPVTYENQVWKRNRKRPTQMSWVEWVRRGEGDMYLGSKISDRKPLPRW
jgi:hypothetical protein